MKYTGRRLPLPQAFLEPTGEKSARDWFKWKTLPADLKADETHRMHSFLLLKPDDSRIERFGYRPFPLVFASSSIDPESLQLPLL
jgi:hypothetical protein